MNFSKLNDQFKNPVVSDGLLNYCYVNEDDFTIPINQNYASIGDI